MTGRALAVTNNDGDLRSQLAGMQSSLRHIESGLTEMRRMLPDHHERIVRLEEVNKTLSRLPDDVADNKITNAVQSAVRQQHDETAEKIRKIVFGGVAAAGTVAGLVSVLVTWLTGGA
jgi:sulfur transfer protein SufE